MPCVALTPMRSFRRQLRKNRSERRLAKKEKRLSVKAQKLAQRTTVKLQKRKNRAAVKAAQLALKQERRAQKQVKAQKQPNLQAPDQNSTTPVTPVATAEAVINPNAPQLMHDGFEVKIRHQRKSFLPANVQPAIDTPTPQPAAEKVLTAKPAPRFFARKKVRPSRSELINAESRLGSQIFGPIPAGHRREFFHDQRNIWIWYEDWTDDDNQFQQMTVRYEVRPTGIYKKIAAGHYVRLEAAEQENFRHAAHVYLHLVKQQLYNFV